MLLVPFSSALFILPRVNMSANELGLSQFEQYIVFRSVLKAIALKVGRLRLLCGRPRIGKNHNIISE